MHQRLEGIRACFLARGIRHRWRARRHALHQAVPQASARGACHKGDLSGLGPASLPRRFPVLSFHRALPDLQRVKHWYFFTASSVQWSLFLPRQAPDVGWRGRLAPFARLAPTLSPVAGQGARTGGAGDQAARADQGLDCRTPTARCNNPVTAPPDRARQFFDISRKASGPQRLPHNPIPAAVGKLIYPITEFRIVVKGNFR
jgi:hypothetical protein